MRGLFRLFVLLAVLFCGGVVVIRLLYDVSWRESLEIADPCLLRVADRRFQRRRAQLQGRVTSGA